MQPYKSKGVTFIVLGIITLGLFAAGIAMLAVNISEIVRLMNIANDPLTPSADIDPTALITTIFGFAAFLGIGGILNLVTSIVILATSYKGKDLNQSKMIWGLLNLFLLDGIGAIVFGIKLVNFKNEDSPNTLNPETIRSSNNSDTPPII